MSLFLNKSKQFKKQNLFLSTMLSFSLTYCIPFTMEMFKQERTQLYPSSHLTRSQDSQVLGRPPLGCDGVAHPLLTARNARIGTGGGAWRVLTKGQSKTMSNCTHTASGSKTGNS